MSKELADVYRDYIACLNTQNWADLHRFVQDDVLHNSRALGLHGYRQMLEDDFKQIPDLYFNVQILVPHASHVAARLWFEVTPKGTFVGLPVNGRKVAFAENVFYEFRDGRILEVWSVIDRVAIEAQLR